MEQHTGTLTDDVSTWDSKELECPLVDVGARTEEECSVNESKLTVDSTAMSVRALSEFVCGLKSVLVATSMSTVLYVLLTLLIWRLGS